MDPIEPDFEAFDILIKAGCLGECDGHPSSYYGMDEPIESAYKLANSLISQKKITLEPGTTRRDFTDRLLSTYEDNRGPEMCTYCQKLGINVMDIHDE